MLASPYIQEIASALAQPTKSPNTRSRSRVLCLKLQEQTRNGFKRPTNASSMRMIVESFLKFSPRVQFRDPDWVFIDIASTSHLFKGEEGLMHSAVSLARDLGFGVQCAISDTPSGAQAFATALPGTIAPPGEERDRLKDLSLPLLLHLEGLVAWPRTSTVESMITFFLMLGFRSIGDLSRFTLSSFHERWGELGKLLWLRLHAQDHQVISPLFPSEPLKDYIHLDFPVSLVSLLLHSLEKSLDFLFARLQGRRLFAQKVSVTLHCEYSQARHKIEIEPNTPSRNRELFFTLLENRLTQINLENPIRDFEVDVIPCPEKSHQLDFFEPRTTDQDKLSTLLSLLTQSSLNPGLYLIKPAVLPEKGWQITTNPKDLEAANKELSFVAESQTPYTSEEAAIASQPFYSSSVMQSPRPTRILKEPLPLSLDELECLKVLSSNPIERLEHGWWEDATSRDYYFAVSNEGECLWIFQDLKTQEYFLHGYFD